MMRAAFAGQQRQQVNRRTGIGARHGNDSGASACAPHPSRAHDMPEAAHGREGRVEHLTSDRVVDDVEAAAFGDARDISPPAGSSRSMKVAPRLSMKRAALSSRWKTHRLRARARFWMASMTDAAGATGIRTVAGLRSPRDRPGPPHAVMKNERKRGRFAHAEIGRLERQQIGIDRGEFRQRSLNAADPTGHAIDLVTGLKARHLRADLLRPRRPDRSRGWLGADAGHEPRRRRGSWCRAD